MLWPKSCASRWLAAGGSGGVAAGPAITTLKVAATRTASIIRCAGIAAIAVQVAVWHSFYLAVPWRLAGPVAAAAWGGAAVAYLLRRWPVWQLAAVDSGVYLVLALCARWCVPPVLRGDNTSWLYLVIIGQLVAPAWFTSTVMLTVLALASAAAYSAGAALAPVPGHGPASSATAVALLLAVASAAWCGRRMLYRRAVEADAALERADRDSRAHYVVLSRLTERREHERLLHDTVLNTLTALAHGGAADVAGRCRGEVGLIERALADPGDERPGGDVLARIEAVAAQMRSRGLEVHVEVTAGPVPAVPARVARATAHAVREALANVAGHAGTSKAWIEVGREEDDGFLVTVRDAGAGFDPDQVAPGRLGVRRSIAERMADQGGQASVRSAPGEGTVVSLRWAAPPYAVAGGASGWDGAPW